MKKITSCIITISLILAMCVPTFAAFTAPTMEEYQVLDAAVRNAHTDEEATVAMYNLIDFFERLEDAQEKGIMPMSSDLNPNIIDSYVNVTSCSVSPTTVSFNYKVVSLVPSGASLKLGYEYPAATRISGDSFSVESSLGTYSKNLNTSLCTSSIQLVGTFLARDFRATKVFKETYQYAFTGTQYGYKTITQSDVTNNIMIILFLGVTGMLHVQAKVATVTVAVAGLVGMTMSLSDMPAPKVGQYYVTKTWFSGGKMYINFRIWNSENAYNNGEEYLYNRSSYFTLPTF